MHIHPALLPSFPGLHAQRQALRHGVKFSGCTVHFADEGVDTGPIIIQAVVPVFDDDSEETLAARILTYEHQIYPRAIPLYAEGRLRVRGRHVTCRGSEADRAPGEGWGYMPPERCEGREPADEAPEDWWTKREDGKGTHPHPASSLDCLGQDGTCRVGQGTPRTRCRADLDREDGRASP